MKVKQMPTDKLSLSEAAAPLFIQRLAISVFMGVWIIDKFVNPAHASGVFAKFYGLPIDSSLAMTIGLVQAAILAAFLLGYRRTISYLLILLMHGVSTLASWRIYAALFGTGGNLLFWAAIPVLAAMWVQFALRRHDSISLDGRARASTA